MGYSDDGTMQLAVKASTNDQFATLCAPVYQGRNLQALPFASVVELISALEDLAQNTTKASAATRLATSARVGGGAAAASAPASRGYGGNTFGGGYRNRSGNTNYAHQIMVVGCPLYLDEDNEFRRVWTMTGVEPFYVSYPDREAKDKARRAFGGKCLNCGTSNPFHMARECREGYMNVSGIINPSLGEGSADQVEKKWRSWQQRLCAWSDTHHREQSGNPRSSPPRRR